MSSNSSTSIIGEENESQSFDDNNNNLRSPPPPPSADSILGVVSSSSVASSLNHGNNGSTGDNERDKDLIDGGSNDSARDTRSMNEIDNIASVPQNGQTQQAQDTTKKGTFSGDRLSQLLNHRHSLWKSNLEQKEKRWTTNNKVKNQKKQYYDLTKTNGGAGTFPTLSSSISISQYQKQQQNQEERVRQFSSELSSLVVPTIAPIIPSSNDRTVIDTDNEAKGENDNDSSSSSLQHKQAESIKKQQQHHHVHYEPLSKNANSASLAQLALLAKRHSSSFSSSKSQSPSNERQQKTQQTHTVYPLTPILKPPTRTTKEHEHKHKQSLDDNGDFSLSETSETGSTEETNSNSTSTTTKTTNADYLTQLIHLSGSSTSIASSLNDHTNNKWSSIAQQDHEQVIHDHKNAYNLLRKNYTSISQTKNENIIESEEEEERIINQSRERAKPNKIHKQKRTKPTSFSLSTTLFRIILFFLRNPGITFICSFSFFFHTIRIPNVTFIVLWDEIQYTTTAFKQWSINNNYYSFMDPEFWMQSYHQSNANIIIKQYKELIRDNILVHVTSFVKPFILQQRQLHQNQAQEEKEEYQAANQRTIMEKDDHSITTTTTIEKKTPHHHQKVNDELENHHHLEKDQHEMKHDVETSASYSNTNAIGSRSGNNSSFTSNKQQQQHDDTNTRTPKKVDNLEYSREDRGSTCNSKSSLTIVPNDNGNSDKGQKDHDITIPKDHRQQQKQQDNSSTSSTFQNDTTIHKEKDKHITMKNHELDQQDQLQHTVNKENNNEILTSSVETRMNNKSQNNKHKFWKSSSSPFFALQQKMGYFLTHNFIQFRTPNNKEEDDDENNLRRKATKANSNFHWKNNKKRKKRFNKSSSVLVELTSGNYLYRPSSSSPHERDRSGFFSSLPNNPTIHIKISPIISSSSSSPPHNQYQSSDIKYNPKEQQQQQEKILFISQHDENAPLIETFGEMWTDVLTQILPFTRNNHNRGLMSSENEHSYLDDAVGVTDVTRKKDVSDNEEKERKHNTGKKNHNDEKIDINPFLF